jgi:enamidase
VALAFATGNVARAYGLDAGVVAEGAPADLILIDAPLESSAGTALEALAIGDIPGIGAVVTDGAVRIVRSRNTPPAARIPVVHEAGKETRGGRDRNRASVHAQ